MTRYETSAITQRCSALLSEVCSCCFVAVTEVENERASTTCKCQGFGLSMFAYRCVVLVQKDVEQTGVQSCRQRDGLRIDF